MYLAQIKMPILEESASANALPDLKFYFRVSFKSSTIR
jgi:hypothetical protein